MLPLRTQATRSSAASCWPLKHGATGLRSQNSSQSSVKVSSHFLLAFSCLWVVELRIAQLCRVLLEHDGGIGGVSGAGDGCALRARSPHSVAAWTETLSERRIIRSASQVDTAEPELLCVLAEREAQTDDESRRDRQRRHDEGMAFCLSFCECSFSVACFRRHSGGGRSTLLGEPLRFKPWYVLLPILLGGTRTSRQSCGLHST